MVQVAYDVTDVEDFEPYAGPVPKRGIYEGVVASAEYGPSSKGNEMYTIIVRLKATKKDHKQYDGCPIWQYYVTGDLSEGWMKRNMKAIVKAFGLKEKGKVDFEKLATTMENKKVRIIVKNQLFKRDDADEGDEGEMQAKGNGLLPFKAADAPEAGDEPEPEPEPEGDEPEPEPEGDEPEPEGDEPEPEGTVEEDIAELDRAALKQYIKDNAEYLPNLIDAKGQVKVYRTMSDDDIRAKILEEWPSEEEPEGDEVPEGNEPPF